MENVLSRNPPLPAEMSTIHEFDRRIRVSPSVIRFAEQHASCPLVLSYRPAMLEGVFLTIDRAQLQRRKLRRIAPFRLPAKPFGPTNGSLPVYRILSRASASFLFVLLLSGCVKAQGPVVQSQAGQRTGSASAIQDGSSSSESSAQQNANGPGNGTSSEPQGNSGLEPQPGSAVVEAILKGTLQANGTVTHLVDGDTVDVAFLTEGAKIGAKGKAGGKGTTERIRLIGIDTPETKRPNTPVECFGREASSALAALIPVGTPVLVERDVEERDRYGRLLGYVFRASDGLFVNHEMVRAGMATPYTFPPNIAYVDVFAAAGDASRAAAAGLWSRCESGHTPAAG
jgi:micrococcal nuclease